jgi:hypothetical protein
MGQISPKNRNVQTGKVGIESLWGFGDLCFNLPLIKAISNKHQRKVSVAVASRCQDALINIPWISEIKIIEELGKGIELFKSLGYPNLYQITQNIKFYEYLKQDPSHSLIDTPHMVGKEIEAPDFDRTPIFIPTQKEIDKADNSFKSVSAPLIAVESIYNSAQSWATHQDIIAMIKVFKSLYKDAQFLWLSNKGAPDLEYVHNMLDFTRRECICALYHCEYFISVGSGFFCANLAIKPPKQIKIYCLWTDELYKYEKPLKQLNWDNKIVWIHNREELDNCLENL